ncbi:MAG: ATP-binding protein, partial [Betaproteobacteria bacterium]
IKIQRIAQNLLLNALKYTQHGGVTVSWGDSRRNDANRWMLCVEDTGPGLHPGPAAPMAGALEEATAEARHVDKTASGGNESRPVAEASPPAATDSAQGQIPDTRGEGIGLSIVKRLCELLDATMEMESDPGDGSTLRIVLPRHYDASATR